MSIQRKNWEPAEIVNAHSCSKNIRSNRTVIHRRVGYKREIIYYVFLLITRAAYVGGEKGRPY